MYAQCTQPCPIHKLKVVQHGLYSYIDNDIHYHRGQNLLQTHAAQPGESAKTFEQCDDEYHCIETMLNPCQFLFYHNNDVKQNNSFSDKGIA